MSEPRNEASDVQAVIGSPGQPGGPTRIAAPEQDDAPATDETVARTAGEEDHSDPTVFIGEDAPPPEETGKAPEGED